MLYTFFFKDGHLVDIDLVEFHEPDGIGAIIDHLASKHGGVLRIEEVKR